MCFVHVRFFLLKNLRISKNSSIFAAKIMCRKFRDENFAIDKTHKIR